MLYKVSGNCKTNLSVAKTLTLFENQKPLATDIERANEWNESHSNVIKALSILKEIKITQLLTVQKTLLKRCINVLPQYFRNITQS